MYPEHYNRKNVNSLQSKLFGHRLKPSQTKYEYLIEFLQVAIAPKKIVGEQTFQAMFPVTPEVKAKNLTYSPQTRIGLKRFIFMPKSKLDGKAEVDKIAYQKCIAELERNIQGGNSAAKRHSLMLIQNLLSGFSVVNQNRSWFDQNLFPICPEVVLPEGMGVKRVRQGMKFSMDDVRVDYAFDYHRYTYMCRGGEIYYLHLLNAINEYPQYQNTIEALLGKMLNSFPQFSFLCDFIQGCWDGYMLIPDEERKPLYKDLGAIPLSFSQRNEYTLTELENFLRSKSHPLEKMKTLANGIILQMLRMMYLAASTEKEQNCWILDINYPGFDNSETRKVAAAAFRHNEEVISQYLYRGFTELYEELTEKDEQKAIKSAADDSYRLFRKMGKMIGFVIPTTGANMRFSLSEDTIKFLVLSIIPPKKMVTLDDFVDLLYKHYGMVIGPEQCSEVLSGDSSFLNENLKAFAQKLKDCGFLRDLSDATAIVENPYESEIVQP